MKLDIPFYRQGKNECGQTSLQMIFEFLGKKIDKDEITSKVDPEHSGATYTVGLARAAAEFGFRVEFYSKYLEINPENYELDFYKKETSGFEISERKLNKIIEDCKRLGVKLEEKSFELDELLGRVGKGVIVLINWNVIVGKEGYQGHFVPIVGYDSENVYFHNADSEDGMNYCVKREIFDMARKSKGTDEDFLVIG